MLAALPWLAAEVAGNDGFDVMLRLVRAEGGTRLYVPKAYPRFADRHPGLCALTHARLLAQANAAGAVETPSAWGVFLALRRVAVETALASGQHHAVVARGFGVSERSLRRLGKAGGSMRNLSA